VLLGASTGCGEQSAEAELDQMAIELLDSVRPGYTEWATMPDFGDRTTSNGPHGQEVTVYMNSTLADALADGPPWPAGSLVVKDGFADDALLLRAAMRLDAGGWFYALFDDRDRIVASGYDIDCVDCHGGRPGSLLTAPTDPIDPPADPDPY